MLKYIVEKFKRRHIKRVALVRERELAYRNLETAKRCILFWIAEEVSVPVINKLREMLAKNMDVEMLAFVQQPKLLVERVEDAMYIDNSLITYSGKFHDAKLQGLLDQGEGLFIDLSLGTDVYGDYIVRCARSNCKIGISREEMLHDIAFANISDIEVFIERLFKLLTRINTY